MKSLAAAKSYAKALFALARERNQAEAIGRELAAAVEQLEREPSVTTLFGRPGAAAAKRGAAVEIARRMEISKLMSDFLVLVATQGRGDQFAAIAAAYRDLVDADLGRVRARVRTAVPLDDAERAALSARLAGALGGTQVIVEEVVDTGLLGGFIAEIGSLIVDGSLDGQLHKMQERLAKA
ncbi:MAG: ATP synthase F1 subunit delta [Candidatus Rokuibacteriota bacterium]